MADAERKEARARARKLKAEEKVRKEMEKELAEQQRIAAGGAVEEVALESMYVVNTPTHQAT